MNVPYLFLPFQDLGTVLECAPKLAAHSNITEKISQISPSPNMAVVQCLGQFKYHIWYLNIYGT